MPPKSWPTRRRKRRRAKSSGRACPWLPAPTNRWPACRQKRGRLGSRSRGCRPTWPCWEPTRTTTTTAKEAATQKRAQKSCVTCERASPRPTTNSSTTNSSKAKVMAVAWLRPITTTTVKTTAKTTTKTTTIAPMAIRVERLEVLRPVVAPPLAWRRRRRGVDFLLLLSRWWSACSLTRLGACRTRLSWTPRWWRSTTSSCARW
mmetsp:Transcript_16171/g.32246  ORF Transcript_16171/g.32246 Transcript_16171/m.32246 type:complete len:204 (+) Transcript_16171:382-993(+)